MPTLNIREVSGLRTPSKIKTIRSHPEQDKIASRSKIYGKEKWRRLRLWKLQQQPYCECCMLDGKYVLATDVHHADSFLNYNGSLREEKAYDHNNLISLCTSCHCTYHALLKDQPSTGQDAEQIHALIANNRKYDI